MRWILPAVLLMALGFLPSPSEANAQQPFQPAYNIVSVTPNGVSARGNVVQHIGAPATDHVIGGLKFMLPAGWDIANVQSNDDSPVVGTGLLQVDVDQTDSGGPPCDSVMESYQLTILDTGSNLGDPPEIETNWLVVGFISPFPFTVKFIAGAQRIEGTMFQNPPEVCALTTLDLTFQGVSTDNPSTEEAEAGRGVLLNPATAGVYTWTVEFKSKPPTDPGAHTAVRCDQMGIGGPVATDTDADGIANTCDNCPNAANASQLNWDEDSTGDVCDPDIDGDSVANGADQCAFTPLGRAVDANGCSQDQVDLDLDGVCDPGKASPTFCTGSDNCPTTANGTQANVVHPLTPAGDACEDPEADGWTDDEDNCPDGYNPFQEDGDVDGIGNICEVPACSADPDCDNDNVSDGRLDPDAGGPIVAGPDNCLQVANTNQLNQDADSLGNACDNCPTVTNQNQLNQDADSHGSACDNCPTVTNQNQLNQDTDGFGDVCENCPTVTNQDQLNIDGDSFGDACDAGDFDGDAFSDRVEYAAGTDRGADCPIDTSHNAWPPDVSNNGITDTADIATITGRFGQSVPPAPARYNIAPDPPSPNPAIDTADIANMTARFGESCLP